MTEDVAREYKIPIYKTINEVLCLGGKELAVDAVLSIGEHGQYLISKLGQVEYPRKQFFDDIVAVMRRSQRFVPVVEAMLLLPAARLAELESIAALERTTAAMLIRYVICCSHLGDSSIQPSTT